MISWEKLDAAITKMQSSLRRKKACIGFDGYVDSLYRVVKSRESLQNITPFDTILDFANHVTKASGRSADMELVEVSRRMGGNAPLMTQALGSLDVISNCIGTMGYPELDDVYSADCLHFTPYSVAPSASSIAFEFSDGKLMFGQIQSLQTLSWDGIVRMLGLDTCRRLYRECDLWGIVNWSFILHCNDIIEGFMRDVVDAYPANEIERKILFLDLADPSSRSQEELLRLVSLIGQMNKKIRVVLGLNENEFARISATLGLPENQDSDQRASALRDKLGVYLLAIHGLDYALGVSSNQIARAESVYNPNPVISTGGGDNFNAGLCTALIHDVELVDALTFGNMVSSYYVSYGKSPSLPQLREYMKNSVSKKY